MPYDPKIDTSAQVSTFTWCWGPVSALISDIEAKRHLITSADSMQISLSRSFIVLHLTKEIQDDPACYLAQVI